MNYDFKSNWERIVLPLIKLPAVQKSIKKGIKSWIKSQGGDISKSYDKDAPPASYERSDGWVSHMDEYKDVLTQELFKTGFLQASTGFREEFLKFYRCPVIEHDNDGDSDYDDDDFDLDVWFEFLSNSLEPFIKHYEKTSLRAYQIFGACHWWNPTFCLTLAKLIYPSETWFVRSGEEHTTVVNKDKTLVFDILYFNSEDPTLGGTKALNKSKK